jgi:two-component system sensor histidine kinase DesK
LSTSPAPGVREEEAAPRADEGKPALSGHKIPGGPPLARLIMLVVVFSFAVVQVLAQLTASFSDRGLALGIGIPSLVILSALTIWITSAAAEHWAPRRRLATLLAQGLVTYLPIIVLGLVWAEMAGFFAGSVLLLLSGWVAWALFAAVVGSMLAASVIAVTVLSNLTASNAAYLTLLTLLFGLVVFALARLSLLIRYVHAKRGELAQLAVISERMRFARDLHDLLGYSLSAITLKSEFTRRLVGSNPGRARDELAEVLDIARQALADVRIVASGYRNISLAKEASSVTSLLGAAGIDARVDINCGALDEKVDTVFATILREAVTNMLRHSTARHCAIEASIAGETIRLQVSNDGVAHSAASGRAGGGLENLSARLATIGGQITARVRADGWFAVQAEAPLTPPETEPEAGGERESA